MTVFTEDFMTKQDYKEVVELPYGSETITCVYNDAGILLEVDQDLQGQLYLTGNTVEFEDNHIVFNAG